MMNRMVCIIGLLVLLVLPTYPQSPELLKANIPFGFYAGDQWMPAGEYQISLKGCFVVMRSSERTAAVVMVFGGSKVRANDRPSISFSKYSDERIFLARLRNPMWEDTQDLPKSRREREVVSSRVVSQNQPETIVILARLGR